MYGKRIILLVAAIFGCFGNVMTRATRNGEDNTYYLYTRNYPRVPIEIGSSSLPAANIFRSQTAIVIHGYLGSASSSLNPVVKDAFISSSDIINVIVVDWARAASFPDTQPLLVVPSVGRALADFIQILVRNNRVSLDRLHLVGFGVGAHVAGYAGRTLTGRIARITGLDPSASISEDLRLQASDASYVEVIHIDGDEDGSGEDGIGSIDTPIGHVDFYADGDNQAWELFASSLTHNQLIGNQCSTNEQVTLKECHGYTLPMGNNDYNKYGSGIFRVITKTTYPY